MDSMMGEPSTSQHETAPPIETEEADYKGWMAKLCVEPSSDVGTCCLGFWLPCVLYGKIDERLQLIQKGRDPNKVGNGCNGSCMIWAASCGGFFGGLTANRRTRVRGHYGIEGGLVNDCVTSYFCNQCVLMHTDREMGARNGQLNLRTSPVYKKAQIIKLQPLPAQDMRYLSAAEFCAGHGTDDAANTRRSPRARLPTGFKEQTTVSARQHQLKEVINASGIDHTVDVVVKCSKGGPVPKKIKLVKGKQVEEIASQLQAAGFSQGSGDVGQFVQVLNTLTTAEMVTIPIETRSSPPAPKTVKSFFNYFKQDSMAIVNPKSKPGSENRSGGTQSHNLADCTTPNEQDSGTAEQTHTLAECMDEETRSKGKGKNVVSDHSLTDCETIVVAGKRSSNASVQQMSYVHDFADCPVDRKVLEYMEQEEKRSQGHELDNCPVLVPFSRANSVSGTVSANEATALDNCCLEDIAGAGAVEQHVLEDCTWPSSIITQGSQQHQLGDCTTENSIIPEGVQQHQLDDCKRPSSVVSEVVVMQHQLDDCTRLSSIASAITPENSQVNEPLDCCLEEQSQSAEDVKQHRLSQCKRLNSVAPETIAETEDSQQGQQPEQSECCGLASDEIAIAQHRMSECSQLGPMDASATTEHRLSQCSRSSSMSALIVPKNDPHRLIQCTRSSSLPVLDSRRSTEHALGNCSRRSSATVSPSKIFFSANSHSLVDCHCGDSSESSHHTEGLTQEAQQDELKNQVPAVEVIRKADKGKQRTENKSEPSLRGKRYKRGKGKCRDNQDDEDISAIFTRPEEQPRKLDVVVAVDVVVGGKKMKATVVGSTDGNNSPRPSVIRERSAQQALESVLLGPQHQSGHKHGQLKGPERRHPYQRYPRAKLPRQKENSETDGVVVLGVPGLISASIQQSDGASREVEHEGLKNTITAGILSAVTGLGRKK